MSTEQTFKNFKNATAELINLVARMYNSMQPLYDRAQRKINSVRIKLLRDSVDLYDLHSFLNDEYRRASRVLSDGLNDLTLITTRLKYDTVSSFSALRSVVGQSLKIKRTVIQAYLSFVNVYNKIDATSDRLVESIDRVQTLHMVPLDYTSVAIEKHEPDLAARLSESLRAPRPLQQIPEEPLLESEEPLLEPEPTYETFADMVNRKDADYLNRVMVHEDSKLNIATHQIKPEEPHTVDLLHTINDKLNLMEIAINELSQIIHAPAPVKDTDSSDMQIHATHMLQDKVDRLARANEKQMHAIEDRLAVLSAPARPAAQLGKGDLKEAIQTSLETYLVDYMEPLLDRLSVRLKNVVNQNIENFMQALVESEKVQDDRYRQLLSQSDEIAKFLGMFNFERLHGIMQQVVDAVRQASQSQATPEQTRQLLEELKKLNTAQRTSSMQSIAKIQNALAVLGTMTDTTAVRDLERLLRELETFTLRQAGVVTFDEMQATKDWAL